MRLEFSSAFRSGWNHQTSCLYALQVQKNRIKNTVLCNVFPGMHWQCSMNCIQSKPTRALWPHHCKDQCLTGLNNHWTYPLFVWSFDSEVTLHISLEVLCPFTALGFFTFLFFLLLCPGIYYVIEGNRSSHYIHNGWPLAALWCHRVLQFQSSDWSQAWYSFFLILHDNSRLMDGATQYPSVLMFPFVCTLWVPHDLYKTLFYFLSSRPLAPSRFYWGLYI